jgi:hypothetical protein
MDELKLIAECGNDAGRCARPTGGSSAVAGTPVIDFAAWKQEIRAFAAQMLAELAAVSAAAASDESAGATRRSRAELLDEMLEAVSASAGDGNSAERAVLNHFRGEGDR